MKLFKKFGGVLFMRFNDGSNRGREEKVNYKFWEWL